jgi:hypothetical protein
LGTEPDASVPGYGPMEKVKDGQVVVHGMTQADIDEVIAAFAQAARDAKAIGTIVNLVRSLQDRLLRTTTLVATGSVPGRSGVLALQGAQVPA